MDRGFGRTCRGGALAPLAPSDEGAVSRMADWGRDKAGKNFIFLSLRHLLRNCHLPRQREARRFAQCAQQKTESCGTPFVV